MTEEEKISGLIYMTRQVIRPVEMTPQSFSYVDNQWNEDIALHSRINTFVVGRINVSPCNIPTSKGLVGNWGGIRPVEAVI